MVSRHEAAFQIEERANPWSSQDFRISCVALCRLRPVYWADGTDAQDPRHPRRRGCPRQHLSMAVSVPQWSNLQQSQVSKSHTHGQHLHPCNRAVPQNASTSRKAVPSMASFLPVAGGSFVMAWLGIDPTRLSLTTS
jgi:hypothetical protein